jgi:hypothetical protein
VLTKAINGHLNITSDDYGTFFTLAVPVKIPSKEALNFSDKEGPEV